MWGSAGVRCAGCMAGTVCTCYRGTASQPEGFNLGERGCEVECCVELMDSGCRAYCTVMVRCLKLYS